MQRMVSGEEESATNEDVGAHAEGADLVEDEGERVHDRVRAGGALGGRRAHTAKVVARGARGVHGHGARHRVGVGAHPLREPVRRKHMEGVCAGVVTGRTAGRSVAKEKREKKMQIQRKKLQWGFWEKKAMEVGVRKRCGFRDLFFLPFYDFCRVFRCV